MLFSRHTNQSRLALSFGITERQFVQGVNQSHCLQPQATTHDEYQPDLSACTQMALMCTDPGDRAAISQKRSNSEMGAGGEWRKELLLEEWLKVLLGGERTSSSVRGEEHRGRR